MNDHTGQGRSPQQGFQLRWTVACAGLVLLGVVLVARAVHLQVLNKEFLISQAQVRHLRTAKISANRGVITDRNGETLAASISAASSGICSLGFSRTSPNRRRPARASSP